MYFQICCLCASELLACLSLECGHKYCSDCYRNLQIKSKKHKSIECSICLKSERQEHKQYTRFNSPKQLNSVYKSTYNRQYDKSMIDNRNGNGNGLYCFNCEVVFSTQEYLNGHHKNHKIKAEQQATHQFQEQHLRSLKILEAKSQQYKRKQISLMSHLDQMYQSYRNLKTEIKCHFDSLLIAVERQRDRMELELEEIHNKSIEYTSKEIQQIKIKCKELGQTQKIIKYFCRRQLKLKDLLAIKQDIKHQLQLTPIKTNKIKLPKLIQSHDTQFYIRNSINFMSQNQSRVTTNESMLDNKSEVQTDIQEEDMIPRKVRLVQKVRNQLNPSCKFVRNEYSILDF